MSTCQHPDFVYVGPYDLEAEEHYPAYVPYRCIACGYEMLCPVESLFADYLNDPTDESEPIWVPASWLTPRSRV